MRTLVLLSLALLAMSNTAIAADKGDWIIRAGPYGVMPKSNNGDTVDVDDGWALGFNFTYFLSSNLALEVLAATPFTHDVKLINGPKVAEVTHLPPTFTLQYHFNPDEKFSPYAGLGLNYTFFYERKEVGALAGTALDLDASFGLAAQLGVDIALKDDWLLNFDVRYIDIESDAKLNGAFLTKVDVTPTVIAATIGKRF